ncbi:related to secretory pathway protein (exocyst complex protein Sec15) [Phialocephala subalpina]|uniref:Exocyst complex component SEC15 n=1 Tax=Phialocephala subalpina TaxID=576137 RepID=A0A1L7X2Q7_9HELO|nr:related to secretory pathway protein (exocyst complex protein Sec15) [Phialocephala subalpina]
MSRKAPQYDDYRIAVQQIILSSSDSDYLDQLIPALKDATNSNRTPGLMQSLSAYANEREADIERIGLTKHDEFLQSVNQLQKVREGTVALTSEILKLNQSIQASTEKLAAQKEALVDTKAIRQNIAEASEALKESLKILHAVNQAHDLIRKKKYYAALKALDDLQNEHLIPTIQNKYATQHKLADIIQKSIPSSQKAISEAVMSDLNTWLYRIRETSQFLGEVAFYHTELRRTRQKERMESNEYLRNFKLNSAIELVFDESEEFDVLDNDELQVDFTPLFECLHIHEALGQSDKFRSEYAATRRRQKELLLPTSVSLVEDDENSLSSLLEGIAGFAIIEKATMRRAHNLRSPVDVDELWDSMCQTAIALITKALDTIDNAEVLLKIKGVIALFIQTMDGWGYSVTTLDNFLLKLFDKYAELLKKRFSEDFQEIVSTDDYMPMPISNMEEYDKVINVSWFTPEKEREELTFPCVLPFSQMYPLCCIDIRNFLNQFYFFSDDHFQHPNVIDETLKKSLDQLLSEKVCSSLVERLSSQYLGQIVQILINLEHFEIACRELEQLLIAARSSSSAGGPIVLDATEDFRSNKKTAEKRIFELVNSKIDDLIDSAEYDWMAATLETEPSNYMHTMTTYLSNIMSSTLLGLPREIKELIYFDALSHAANMILALPLSPDVKKINPNGVAALAKDVQYLSDFVDTLEGAPILKENLDELQQTVLLMQTENPDDFYDISIRNKKFGRVDAMNGPLILEKITHSLVQSPAKVDRLGNFSSRFGIR